MNTAVVRPILQAPHLVANVGMSLGRNTVEFKSKVAPEALREQQTILEIAKRNQVHASQVTEWKKALQGDVTSVFGRAAYAERRTQSSPSTTINRSTQFGILAGTCLHYI